jgi:ribonuclease E
MTTHDDQAIRAEGAFAGQPGEAGPRRRRRRRRGRRGGNRDQFAPGAPHAGAPTAALDTPATVEDRFGPVSDDIDTTPRDEPRVAPNASSSPSWTLQEPAEIDTTPKDEDKPAKKGWWQRAFRT